MAPLAVVPRTRTHEKRLDALERRNAPARPAVVVLREGDEAALAALRAKYGAAMPQVIELRERAVVTASPQAQRPPDAARAQDLVAERRHADGKDSLAAAGATPEARERAEAQARDSAKKLQARAARVLEWLGAEAFDGAARVRVHEAVWKGHLPVAALADFEADARGYSALRAGHLEDPDARALIDKVESARVETEVDADAEAASSMSPRAKA